MYRYKKKRTFKVATVLKYFFIFLVCFIAAGLLYQNIYTSLDEQYIVESGKTIALDKETNVFYNAVGRGAEEVIFVSDIETPMNQWDATISENYGVMSSYVYQRTGYLPSSEKGQTTIDGKVDELREVANRITTHESQVLVAEGYGALLAMEYAKKYPENVKGLLLVNPLCKAEYDDEDYFKNSFLSFFSKLGLVRILNKFQIEEPTKELTKYLNEDQYRSLIAYFNSTKYNEAKYSEIATLKDYDGSENIENILGEKPMLLVTTNSLEENISHGEYVNMQKEYLKLSNNSEHIEKDSSYYFQYEHPEELAKYIELLINRSK